MKHRRRAVLAALPLVVAVACGGDDEGTDATATASGLSPTVLATTAPSTMPTTAAATTTPATTSAPGTTAPTPSPAPDAPAGVDVEMRLIAFRPDHISVAAGETIRFTQSDAGFHTVTSGTVDQSGGIVTPSPDGRFDSGQLATDATFELTLTEPGTYEFFCAIHPATMHGVVDVT